MIFEQHISILELFLKDLVILKTGVMMLKILPFRHRNKLNSYTYSHIKHFILE